MTVLHIVNKSPYERNSLDACLRLSRPDSAILLIEDAVYAARPGATAERVRQASETRRIYALLPDLQARGIDAGNLLDGIETVDYDGFVTLATEHEKLQSWL